MVGRKDNKRIGESPDRERYLYAVLYAVVLGFSVAAGSNIVFGGDVSDYPQFSQGSGKALIF